MTIMHSTRLLTPGPTPIPDRVRLAMAQPMIHHRKPEFKKVLDESQAMLRQLFACSQPVLPLACSGTGAMSAAVHGLFEPGEKVIVVDGGKFGERWGQIAAGRGLECVSISLEWGQAVSPAQISQALEDHPETAGILVQASETSTGVMHPIAEIASLTRNSDVLLVVDGISAVGISPLPMDPWGIDCLLTGSQKGLMVPPGLALLALSERAWAKAECIQSGCFYFNLPKERDNCLKNQTLFTSPVSLLVGLHEALSMIFEDGLDALYRKQWALTQLARSGISALGLELLAPEHYTWGLTSVRMPESMPASAIVRQAAEKFGVVMTTGQAPMKDQMLRLGHMGWVDWADVLAGLHALAASLPQPPQRPYMEEAMAAWEKAMAAGPGQGF